MKDSFRVAFCGIITAFALILMLLTSIVPIGTYAFPCFAGVLLCAVVIEFSEKWALLSYGAVSVLSLFLAGDKEAVVYFIAFLGFYPIVKSYIERIRSKSVQYILKFTLFNICITAAFIICKFILAIPDEEFTLLGFYVPWAFLIIGEFIFFMYDKCVTILIFRYINSVRNRIFKK